jgi:hypothetical protein
VIEVVGMGGNAKRLETIFQGVTLRIEKAASAFLQRQVCVLHSLLSVAVMLAAIY